MGGFLEDRALMMKTSKNRFSECHYFFGCRNEREVLYHDKLLDWESRGVANLHIGYSRQKGAPKQYVQDLLEDFGPSLASLLLHKDGTHVYICGDARMAKSCTDTCISALQKYGNMSKIAALRYITQLRMKNRLQSDVWGDSAVEETDTGYNVKSSQQLKRASQKAWVESLTMEPVMDSPKKTAKIASKSTEEDELRKAAAFSRTLNRHNSVSHRMQKQSSVKDIASTSRVVNRTKSVSNLLRKQSSTKSIRSYKPASTRNLKRHISAKRKAIPVKETSKSALWA